MFAKVPVRIDWIGTFKLYNQYNKIISVSECCRLWYTYVCGIITKKKKNVTCLKMFNQIIYKECIFDKMGLFAYCLCFLNRLMGNNHMNT